MVNNRHGEETRPVEVDIGIQIVVMVPVKCLGTCLWDMGIAQILAQH